MNRSIDLMEELRAPSNNIFRMNRRGYLYVTGDESGLDEFKQEAERVASLGAGPLRVHIDPDLSYDPFEPTTALWESPTDYAQGADLLLSRSLIRQHFPYLTEEAAGALHVRRAGWLSAQQLGMCLLEQARAMGVLVEAAAVEQVIAAGGRVQGAHLSTAEQVDCGAFVNAAGPYLKRVGQLLSVDIPVETELHLKASFKDHLGIVPRNAPLLIWYNPQVLPWEPDEREALRDDQATRWLTEPLPAGAHLRPEGTGESQTVLMLWDYQPRWMEPAFPPPLDDMYPEVTLRGLATMLPGLRRYFGRAPRPYLDGGFYVKTPENRLLAGPLPVGNAFVIGGLSGFGIMSSCAAGELLAAHVRGAPLPPYAAAFSMQRYSDPSYQASLTGWIGRGQL
jgi:glycine/D-amino acid oxidase-like deaminating enzyme